MKFSPLLTAYLAFTFGACAVPSATTTNGQGEKLPTVTANLPPISADLGRPSILEDAEQTATTQPVAIPPKPDRIVRVLIVENSKSSYIKHSGRINVYTQDLSKKYKISINPSLKYNTTIAATNQ